MSAILDGIITEKLNNNNLVLLVSENHSNWNLYKDKTADTVYALAKKDSDASHCIFGNYVYFKRWLANKLISEKGFDGTITQKGQSLLVASS